MTTPQNIVLVSGNGGNTVLFIKKVTNITKYLITK